MSTENKNHAALQYHYCHVRWTNTLSQ